MKLKKVSIRINMLSALIVTVLSINITSIKIVKADGIYENTYNAVATETDAEINDTSDDYLLDSDINNQVNGINASDDGSIIEGDETFIGTTVFNGVDYSDVYNYQYYMEHNPDLIAAYGMNTETSAQNAICHFVTFGMKEGRRASESFDVFSYRKAYKDLRALYGNDLSKYYIHYILFGKNEARTRTVNVSEIDQPVTELNGVDYSPIYDFQYYLDHNPDVKAAYGNDDYAVLCHFVYCGIREGRVAKSTFDVKSYRNAYSDLRACFGMELEKYAEHYLLFGRNEGRTQTYGIYTIQNPITSLNGNNYADVYDYQYYLEHNPDVKAAYGDDDYAALTHFVYCGVPEGRVAKSDFDVKSYKRAYSDLRRAFGNDNSKYIEHYIYCGKNEARTKTVGVTELQDFVTELNGVDYSKVYDYNFYTATNVDVANAYGDDDVSVLKHYLYCGVNEGRQGSANFSIRSYQLEYQDLRRAYHNDYNSYLNHYIGIGYYEGRNAVGTTTLQNPISDYNGYDYSQIYSYNYYSSHNSDVASKYGNDDAGMIHYFMTTGMKNGDMASDDFQATSYQNRYQDLRYKYRSDLTAYARDYIESGKASGRVATGCSETVDPVSTYNGVDYSSVYDFNYYKNHNSYVKTTYGGDDVSAIEYFVNTGMSKKDQANETFSITCYYDNYNDLYDAYGENYSAYYKHYVNSGKNEGRVADHAIYKTKTPKISNSGHDENNKYRGGAAGDNNGTEWHIINWFNRPWSCVLRYSDTNVANTLATLSEQAAYNDCIGYDQNQRTTYWANLSAVGFWPSSITNLCEADCSSGVAANIKATGYIMGVSSLTTVSERSTTYNLRSQLTARGFTVLTGQGYTSGTRYLKRGDILLNDQHHVAVVTTDGRIQVAAQ